MTEDRVGTTLQGRYRVGRKLGEGGMGAVYEGEHLLIGRRVAIKFLHKELAADAGAAARFLQEAKASTAIQHKHIVEVTDMGQAADGALYLVLEFLEGRDWGEELNRSGAQPLSKVAHIATQVCDALSAAHTNGVIHRDLKPENIFLVDRDGDPDFVKVVDFGISKMTGDENNMTKTGTVLGTPYFMSPEQARDSKTVDARADLYALGVVMFRALTQRFPFEADTYGSLVVQICTEPAPSVRLHRPDLAEDIAGVLSVLLAKDPAGRFQSAAAVKEALVPFLTHRDARSLEPSRAVSTAFGTAPTALPLPAVFGQTDGQAPSRASPPSHAPPSSHASTPRQKSEGKAALPMSTPRPAETARSLAEFGGTAPTQAVRQASSTRWPLYLGLFAVAGALGVGGFVASSMTGEADTVSAQNGAESGVLDPRIAQPTSVQDNGEPVPPDDVLPTPAEPEEGASIEGLLGQVLGDPEPSSRRREPFDDRPPDPAAESVGTVNISTRPWAAVFLDGEPLGRNTPIVGLRVAAGSHRIGLQPQDGVMREFTINVSAGQRVNLIRDLREAPAGATGGEAAPATMDTQLGATAARAVIQRGRAAITTCFDRALRSNPSLSGGRIVLAISVSNGNVRDARVQSSSVDSEEAEGCVLEEVRGWRFPAGTGGSIAVPLVFRRP